MRKIIIAILLLITLPAMANPPAILHSKQLTEKERNGFMCIWTQETPGFTGYNVSWKGEGDYSMQVAFLLSEGWTEWMADPVSTWQMAHGIKVMIVAHQRSTLANIDTLFLSTWVDLPDPAK